MIAQTTRSTSSFPFIVLLLVALRSGNHTCNEDGKQVVMHNPSHGQVYQCRDEKALHHRGSLDLITLELSFLNSFRLFLLIVTVAGALTVDPSISLNSSSVLFVTDELILL